MPKVCGGPYLRLRKDTTEAGGRVAYLFGREFGFRTTGDISGSPPMWVVRTEAIADQGRGHLGNEGGVWIPQRSPAILRSMHLLPYLDPSFHAHRRTALRPAEEEQEIRMDEGTYGGGLETKTNAYRGTGLA